MNYSGLATPDLQRELQLVLRNNNFDPENVFLLQAVHDRLDLAVPAEAYSDETPEDVERAMKLACAVGNELNLITEEEFQEWHDNAGPLLTQLKDWGIETTTQLREWTEDI